MRHPEVCMPSFDVVSQVNMAELDNALSQAKKELDTRYDFKNTKASIEKQPKDEVLLKANSDERLGALRELLLTRVAKRGISLRNVEFGKVEESGLQLYKQTLTVKQGIAVEKAKTIVALIKDSKLKVQGSIQGDAVRVSGKNRDDLQSVIALLRGKADELNLELQYINFRD
jgi:uncharacterized protein YajQ (UPF0234 family)